MFCAFFALARRMLHAAFRFVYIVCAFLSRRRLARRVFARFVFMRFGPAPRPGAIWLAFGAPAYGCCGAAFSAKVKKASKQRFWGWLQAKYQPFSSRARSAAKACPAGISLW